MKRFLHLLNIKSDRIYNKDCRYVVMDYLKFYVLITILVTLSVTPRYVASFQNGTEAISEAAAKVSSTEKRSQGLISTKTSTHKNTTSEIIETTKSDTSGLSSKKHISATKIRNSTSQKDDAWNEKQIKRHAYNVSGLSLIDLNSTASFTDSTTADDGATDELKTSDTRFAPTYLSRQGYDDEFDTPTEEESPDGLDSYSDQASTNLREQRVVKELTKILSKGMSGATDQVRLDALENWKKKQKERKAIKDTRSKLFEDLLTAAINSHPEKAKRKSGGKKQHNNKDDGGSFKTSTGLLNNQEVDPEMAVDAESILQQLQGVASVMEHQPQASDVSNGGELGGGETSSASNEDTSSEESTETSDDKPEKAAGGSKKATQDRPIVRQFKKIKAQISQRRKQLDQIKKIFNVELALNPKDGTLIGKPTSASSKKEHKKGESEHVQEFGDFTVIDDSTSSTSNSNMEPSSRRKKSSGGSEKSSKMKNLKAYLRDNPEILASVMAELTTDTDPRYPASSSLLAPSNSDDTSSYLSSAQLNNEYGDFNMGGLSSRKSSSHVNLLRQHDGFDGLAWDKRRRSSRMAEAQNYDSPPPISRLLASSKGARTRNLLDIDSVPLAPITMKPKSAEAALLESLRERQLVNLARLEKALAESQEASNRSHVYSTLNSSISTSLQNIKNDADQTHNSYRRTNLNLDRQSINNESSSTHKHHSRHKNQSDQYNSGISNNNQPDEETLHHFMFMSQPNSGGEIPPPSALQNDRHTGNTYPSEWRQMDRPPAKSSYDHQSQQYQSSMGSSGSRSNQQHEPPTLNRFKEWRDVSQTESGPSQRSDGPSSAPNVTWLPYESAPGIPATSYEGQPRLSASHNSYRQQLRQHHQKPYNETQYTYPAHYNQQIRVYSDASVTRPGLGDYPSSYHNGYQMMPTNSMFMTRSSAATTNEFTTTIQPPLATYHDLITTTTTDNDKQPVELRNSAIGRKSASRHKEKRDGERNNGRSFEDEPDIEESSVANSTRPVTPVDYFSAYKHEPVSESQRHQRHMNPHGLSFGGNSGSRSVKTRRDLTMEWSQTNPDELGAMWAKS